MPKRKWLGILLFFALLLSACLLQQAQAQPAKGYPVNPLNLVEAGGQARPLSLKGARNEYLLSIFALDGARIEDLKLDLKSRDPASPKLFLQVYQLRPVPHNLPPQFSADGMVPLEPGLIYPESPAKVAVSFKIPEETPAGRHLYELTFHSGARRLTQPLEVEVWNFSLPDDLPITILVNFWGVVQITKKYGFQDPQVVDVLSEAYLRSFRDYKVNAVYSFGSNLLPIKKVVEGAPVATFTKYTRMLDYVLNLGYRYFVLPHFPGARDIGKPNNHFIEEAGRFYPAFYRYLQSRNLVNRALVQVLDEPKADAPYAFQAYEAVKRAVPQFRTLCTGAAPNPALAPVINIWATFRASYNAKQIAAARSKGQEIWLYANALMGANRPSVDQRLIGWNLFYYGFNGYYLFSVDCLLDDPWTVPPGPNSFMRRGTLYYPHPRTGMPLPTLRWEAYRRGLQDYQYLVRLREAHGQGKVPGPQYAEIQQRLEEYGRFASLGRVNWGDLEKVREQIGMLLSRQVHQKALEKPTGSP